MASEWFDSVTGSNDYERQSARDSYNGGRAYGDWSGGVNARLDRERAQNSGYTVSGSSREMSAGQAYRASLDRGGGGMGAGGGGFSPATKVTEVQRIQEQVRLAVKHGNPKTAARLRAQLEEARTREAGTGPAQAVVIPAARPVATAGPGMPGAQTVPVPAGSGLVPIGPQGPRQTPAAVTSGPGIYGTMLTPQFEPTVQQLVVGGTVIEPNPQTSNAEEWEIRYAEPGEFVGGIVVFGSDVGYNAAEIARKEFGYDRAATGRASRAVLAREWDNFKRDTANVYNGARSVVDAVTGNAPNNGRSRGPSQTRTVPSSGIARSRRR